MKSLQYVVLLQQRGCPDLARLTAVRIPCLPRSIRTMAAIEKICPDKPPLLLRQPQHARPQRLSRQFLLQNRNARHKAKTSKRYLKYDNTPSVNCCDKATPLWAGARKREGR